jgi:hypothetical protein
MRTVREWWRELNGLKKGMFAAFGFVLLGSTVTVGLVPYKDVPERVEANAQAIDSLGGELTEYQIDMHRTIAEQSRTLARIICLLLLEENEQPLSCEM